ncbi:MAG: flagellar biosynthetic protein FliO [Vampirovibrionales bacterium]|nr:flagellar biosynthetic protein FliO [Vampirovibrionales bacterium]
MMQPIQIWPLFLKLVFYTGALVVFLLGVYWTLKHRPGQLKALSWLFPALKQPAKPDALTLEASLQIDARKSVIIVRHAPTQQAFLMANTSDGIQLLSELKAADAALLPVLTPDAVLNDPHSSSSLHNASREGYLSAAGGLPASAAQEVRR